MYQKSSKIFLLLLLIVLGANAQRYHIVIGPDLSLPTGNSTNQSPIGFGGYLKGEVGLNQKFSITGSGGVVSFLGKKFIGPRTASSSSIPVKVGFKYYTERSFYFEGQLGAVFPLNGIAENRFAWSPGAGTFIRSRKSKNELDIGFRYEGWTRTGTTTFTFFSLRAGYAFNL